MAVDGRYVKRSPLNAGRLANDIGCRFVEGCAARQALVLAMANGGAGIFKHAAPDTPHTASGDA